MEKTYITDTDFVNSFYLEEEETYNFVYGILLYSSEEFETTRNSNIFQLITSLLHNQNSTVLATVMAKYWLNISNKIIEKLNKLGDNVRVCIPFCGHYSTPIHSIIRYYKLASNILEEYIQNKCQNINDEWNESFEDIYPIYSMETLFTNAAKYSTYAPTDEKGNPIDPNIIFIDELVRRGIINPANASNHFGENEYKDMVYHGARAIISETEDVDISTYTQEKSKKSPYDNVQMTSGVIYYITKQMLEHEINEDIIRKLVCNLTDFVTDREEKKKNNKDSIGRYLRDKEHTILNKNDKKDFIKNQLNRFDLEIPSELDE